MHGPFRLQDVPTQPSDLVEEEWKPVRDALGIMGFRVNAYVATAAGQVLIEDHSERDSGYEDLYIVMAGSVDFTLERDDGTDDSFIIPAGNLVFVPPRPRSRSPRPHAGRRRARRWGRARQGVHRVGLGTTPPSRVTAAR